MVILGVATAVAWESQQRRQTVRIEMAVPAQVVTRSGTIVHGTTANMSPGGVMIHMEREFFLPPAESVKLIFPVLDGDADLPATVVQADGNTLRAQFDPLTLQQEEALTMVLYSRADTWLGWGESREVDRPLVSLRRIFQLSIYGLVQDRSQLLQARQRSAPPKGRLATSIVPVLHLFPSRDRDTFSVAPPGRGALRPDPNSGRSPVTRRPTAASNTRDGGRPGSRRPARQLR